MSEPTHKCTFCDRTFHYAKSFRAHVRECQKKQPEVERQRGRPRKQEGWLYQESGSWRGQYRVYSRGGFKRRSVTLGNVAEMAEVEARALLRGLIDREEKQTKAAISIGASSSLPFIQEIDRTSPVYQKTTKGHAAELLVCADLILKGMDVFRSVHPHASCDVIYIDGSNVIRVEVKWGGLVYDQNAKVDIKRNVSKFDMLAVVFGDGTIKYVPHCELTHSLHPLRKTTQESENFAKELVDKDSSIVN